MSQIMPPFQLLELSVISAQDLAPVGRTMRTYAVSWVHPDRKLSTCVDTQGHNNPTWNDKFVFRVDEEFLCSDSSAIMIEIYALHWFKDIHVGTVRVLVGNLAPPPSRPSQTHRTPLGTRFVALQVRRPSGRPQGILNIGFTILDGSMHNMPLYTHNPSAVGYRHLMGEKDAYDSHNHLSPHVLAGATPKPELRRSKSDTSSVVASEAVARQHRAKANHNRANSNISAYQVNLDNTKKGKKKKSRSPSNINEETCSMLSDTVQPWKIKSGKTSPHEDDILHVEEISPLQHYRNDVVYEDVHNQHHDHDAHSDANSDSDVSIGENNFVTEAMEEEYVPVNNVTYEVCATPQHQFRNSPAPHYINSPAPQFRNSPARQHMSSPAPQFKNSPAPQYMNSPALQYKNSPKPHYMSSPAPQFKNSPAPHYMSSPAPQFKNSPAPQFKNSPKPQYMNSPKPQYMNSPVPQFKNSPAPQYVSSPAPQFKNLQNAQYIASPKPQYLASPKPQYLASPKPQFRNSPAVVAPQFRASPTVSNLNPNRGTPMHTYGKVNGGMEYMTPRRSNLGNMGQMVMTESELGPSPSEVAAAIARKPIIDEGENEMAGGWSLDGSMEGLQSKMERWRSDLPPVVDQGELSSHRSSSTKTSRHSRRHTDGGSTPGGGGGGSGSGGGSGGKGKGKGRSGAGLFSCFSKICGVECYVGCGSDSKGKKGGRRRSSSMEDNTSSLL
ncbi:serine/arginine repetitive matrix protein 1-like [Vigna unguiculata]|uniref:serine/arginine repetitive matrix protein 1-like n=1 Tax=Vigna unguiculata TaxID=3917 RepID=UPI001015F67D|nr:serine/arginine repetitive matrix protein 1-like [Vigna unguiculata]